MGMNTNQNLLRLAAATAVAGATIAAYGQAPNPTDWQSTAGLNLAVAKGNSDTLLAGGNILSTKKWDKNEWILGADAAYGDTKIGLDGRRTTAQNYGAFAQYNRLIDDRWYWWLNGALRQDRISDVDYRFTLSGGVGYYFVKTDRTTLKGEVGPGVVFERVGNHDTKYMTIRFAEHFLHKFENGRASVFQNAEFLPQINKWDNYQINFDAGVEASLTDKMGVRVTFADNYRSRPAPGLKNNDLRLLAGLTYKF